MSDTVKLIVDIDEEQYEFIKQGMPINKVVQYPALMEAICEHIANGTPLPKGHGDLIDRKELLKQPMDTANYPSNYVRIAQAIIEADTESEE